MQEIGEIIENNTFEDKKGETRKHKINVIPHNMEKYMAFTLGNNLAFIDSLQFMNQSLANLVKIYQKKLSNTQNKCSKMINLD